MALQDLRDFVDENGPFDAVLGFSQGASLAASFIAHYGQGPLSGSSCDFKCAIFMCAINGVHIRGEGRFLNGVDDGEIIQIPTVHIIGSKDPYREESLGLTRICDHRTRVVLDHKGGHEVPRGNTAVSAMASCISKALETAALLQ
jgi:predicted esterase